MRKKIWYIKRHNEAVRVNKNLNWAIFKFATDTRKRMLSYSGLCETSADKVDAAKLEIPEGFKFLKLELIEVF